MANIIGVKFHPRGRLVYCDAGEISPQVNDYVVLDSGQGLDVAKVVTLETPSQPGEQSMVVLRRAEIEDLEEARRKREQEALIKCYEMVSQLGLKMKPLAARYDFEDGRLTIFFSAQERVD
ncbi:MAG TPA: hypothetical protein ENN57_03945, partial [Chloroflexi bacterium]|nr:hypothetical protein [Chloroflexota bacterium]